MLPWVTSNFPNIIFCGKNQWKLSITLMESAAGSQVAVKLSTDNCLSHHRSAFVLWTWRQKRRWVASFPPIGERDLWVTPGPGQSFYIRTSESGLWLGADASLERMAAFLSQRWNYLKVKDFFDLQMPGAITRVDNHRTHQNTHPRKPVFQYPASNLVCKMSHAHITWLYPELELCKYL